MDDDRGMGFNNRGIRLSQTWGSTWEVGKGNDVLEPVGWVTRRRRGAAGELGVSHAMGGARKTEVPTLARRPLPRKGTGQVGTTRNEREEHS